MGDFINRNPEHMIQYARDTRAILQEMTMLIRKVESLLDACAPDLDAPTQRQIQALHQCCASYFRQMEVYERVADDVCSKGYRLRDIRNGG